jgi:hypothetical protein
MVGRGKKHICRGKGVEIVRRKDWAITNHATRPAGKQGECFYCNNKLGEQHKPECVIKSKTIVADFTIRVVLDVPERWDKSAIENHYNHGSWCADNLIGVLERKLQKECLCNNSRMKFVREATKEDEEEWIVTKVDELES